MVNLNVLIEIEDKDFAFKNPVKVFFNFDPKRPIGVCYIRKTDEGLRADFQFSLAFNPPKEPLWPAIGYVTHDKCIDMVGISTSRNVDPNIMPL